jgi:hypothetical protein
MDIDDDGTQRAAVADSFGVEPDFDELDEEAKEVSYFTLTSTLVLMSRTGPKKSDVNLKQRSLG